MQHAPDAARHRRLFRADVRGRAFVHADGAVLRCAIENLSLGGALLHALTPAPLRPDDEIGVELGIDGVGWIHQRARVLRCDPPRIAVGFVQLSSDAVERIGDEVLAAIDARRVPRVVLVDRCRERRRHMASALERAGLRALEAATPLETIDLLERSRTRATAAAIHEAIARGGAGLVQFLTDAHPRLGIAVITDAHTTDPAHPRDLPGVRAWIGPGADPAAALRPLLAGAAPA
jgi:hypothetical protein